MLTLFLSMLAKLFPIYATMGAGYGLERVTGNITKGLAGLQIYFITPLVVLTNVMNLKLTPEVVLLPGMMFVVGCFMGTMTRLIAKALKIDGAPAMALAGGTCNAGYLGIPVAMILFPPDMLPLYIVGVVATTLYENSLGCYFIARGQFSAQDAIKKLLSLPTIYALILGLILAGLNIRLPEVWDNFAHDLRGAYVILGALIIGFAMSQVKSFKFDFAFIGTLLAIKHIAWPLVMVGILAIEHTQIGYLSREFQMCLLLMSMMPLAAITVAFSALFNVAPDKTATAVAASTAIGLITIPLTAILLGLTN